LATPIKECWTVSLSLPLRIIFGYDRLENLRESGDFGPVNIVSAENLAKAYGDKQLFEQLSFGVAEGERIGLIGVNGSGKSTLLKIIANKVSPDAGSVTLRSGLIIEHLPQNPEFLPGATVLEAIFHGDSPAIRLLRYYEQALALLNQDPTQVDLQSRLSALQLQMDATGGWSLEAHAKSILTRLGITNFLAPVETLSGGQRKRVAMARALIQPADLLILDEPTNHIDNETVTWLESHLARFSGALMLITHDRYFLDRVVTRILELDRAQLYSYSGNYSTFLEARALRAEVEGIQEQRHQNLLRRELAWLRRGAKARTTKQKARIQRAESLKEIRPATREGAVEIAVSAHRLGRRIIEMESVSKGFDGRSLIRDFTYTVLPKDRIGIIGPNGSGKSTLLNLIAGRLHPDQGTVVLGQSVRLSYYDQESEGMDTNQRVIDYIKETAEVIKTPDGGTITASQMLERFLFSSRAQWTAIARLSGGERRRLYLLKTLMQEPNVLLLDEPTNDLDVQTLSVLEEYLEQFPGVVIAVSHDRYFLDRVAHHLFAFEGDQIRHFMGDYSDYIDVRRSELAAQTEPLVPAVVAHRLPTQPDRPRKLSFKEQREYDNIEALIAGLESQLAEVTKSMATAVSDYSRLQALTTEQSRLETELNRSLDRWAELTELVEAIDSNK